MAYPRPVSDYILNQLITHFYPVYFHLDPKGDIRKWGGPLSRYRIPTPRMGGYIGDLLCFTEGLLPLPSDRLVLDCVGWAGQVVVDVHLFKEGDGIWLVLTDAAPKAQVQERLQQKRNELSLQRDTHIRILDQYLGKGMATRLTDLGTRRSARRCTLSILFADIRGFTAFCEHRSPVDVFDILNVYLAAMIRPVLDHAGIIDKIAGDAIMAVFGVLPTDPSPANLANLAVTAGKTIIANTQQIGDARRRDGNVPLAVGVGVATGSVVLGSIGSNERKTLSITGHSANLAARLESRAAGGELLLDETTMKALDADDTQFTAKQLHLRGVEDPITAYSWVQLNQDA